MRRAQIRQWIFDIPILLGGGLIMPGALARNRFPLRRLSRHAYLWLEAVTVRLFTCEPTHPRLLHLEVVSELVAGHPIAFESMFT